MQTVKKAIDDYIHTCMCWPMPRRNSNKHVITKARDILGLTRQQLAERIGIKRVSLEKIERGERRLTLKVALQVRAVTQVSIDQLMAGKRGRPVDGMGNIITKKSMDEIGNLRAEIPIERVDQFVAIYACRVEFLLDAAAHAEPEKFSVIDYALDEALDKLEKEFGLSRGMSALRNDYARSFIASGMVPERAKRRFAPNTYWVPGAEDQALKNEYRKLRYKARAITARTKRKKAA
jgi:transcriptional regulator with XRE-family HTH domain